MSRLRLIVASAVALVLLLPATALAADVQVSGTVSDKGGAAVAGAEVVVLVRGTDMAYAATTDANGAWALQLEAQAGDVIEVNGTGPTVTTGPDDEGCTTSTSTSGQATVTVPEEGEADVVALTLDRELSGTVCAATGKQGSSGPAITPPATDTATSGSASTAGTAMLLLLGGLVAFMGLALRFSARRR